MICTAEAVLILMLFSARERMREVMVVVGEWMGGGGGGGGWGYERERSGEGEIVLLNYLSFWLCVTLLNFKEQALLKSPIVIIILLQEPNFCGMII